MNSYLKAVVIVLQLIVLTLTCLWYKDDSSYEPLILLIGQISSIVLVIFDKQVSKLWVKDVDSSRVVVESVSDSSDSITVQNVKNKSYVKVKQTK